MNDNEVLRGSFKTLDTLNIFYQNICSLKPKVEEIRKFAKINNIDVICLVETWMRPFEVLKIPGYHEPIETKRERRRGGGVAIYIKENLTRKQYANIQIEGIMEAVVVEIETGKNSLPTILSTYYRPPGGKVKQALDITKKWMMQPDTNQKIILVGDMNINTMSQSGNLIKLSNFINSKGLQLNNNEATRGSKSCIDLCLSNFDPGPIATIETHLSDHKGLLIKMPTNKPKMTTTMSTNKFNFSETNLRNVLIKLTEYDTECHEEINNSTGEESFYMLQMKIQKIVKEKCLNTTKPTKNNEDWFTDELWGQRKCLNKLYAKARARKTNQSWLLYKEHKQRYRQAIREAKQQCFTMQLKRAGGNSKKMWKTLQELLGYKKRGAPELPKELEHEGRQLQDKKEIAETLSYYFSIIGTNFKYQPKTEMELYKPKWGTPGKFSLADIQMQEVDWAISQLAPKTSTSYDLIPNKLLKFCREWLVPHMEKICNKCFKEGKMPTSAKLADVIFLHKGGQKKKPDNWRPISLLPALSKIIEKVVNRRLTRYFESNNLWYKYQYGFRASLSTTHAIAELVNEIQNLQQKHKLVIVIFMDIAKAFNCLNHQVLLKKLKWYGINGKELKFFESYLSNRRQQPKLEGNIMPQVYIPMGTPQGGILSATQFIIYNNDLPTATNMKTILYADDTTMIKGYDTWEELEKETNNELMKVSQWFETNQLKLNAKKSQYIIYRKNIKQKDVNISINDEVITRVGRNQEQKFAKFLGVRISDTLDFHDHVNHVVSKISSGHFMLRQARHCLSVPNRMLVYHALIESHITYAAAAWASTIRQTDTKLIAKLQRNAVRVILNARKTSHTEQIFKKLQILKFQDIPRYQVQKIYIDTKFGARSPIKELFEKSKNIQHAENNYQLRQRPPPSKPRDIKSFFMQEIQNVTLREISCKALAKEHKVKIINSYTFICKRKDCISCL